MINVFLINFFFWPFKVTVIQATSLDLKTLNEEPDIYDLPIAPLFGSFSSPCKEPAKPKDEHQNYFILEKSVYNSFWNDKQAYDSVHIHDLNLKWQALLSS